MDLTGIQEPFIQFNTWWEIESAGPVEHDLMRVQYSLNGGATWLQGALLNEGLVNGGTRPVPVSNKGVQTPPEFELEDSFVSLGQAGGEPAVLVRFLFDTVDTLANGFRGWGVDDVQIFDPASSTSRPVQNFEGSTAGWTTTGFWHVVDDAQNIGMSAEAIALVSLAPGDDGGLPADPNGARFAWFGEDATGTYCGADALDEPPASTQPPATTQPPAATQPPSASQPPVQQQPQQQQPSPDPFPPDIPTAASIEQLPDPEPFEEVNIEAIRSVFVRLPGGRGGAARASQAGTPTGFIPLTQAAQVPVGSIVEASRGRVSLESTADAAGLRMQTADFYNGRFQIRQPRSRNPVTEMVLKGGNFRSCRRTSKRASGAPRADASQRRGRRVRRVWGNGRGRFRTRGRYSSATVRGTTWLTEDYCNGTLTRVARRPRTNRVLVQDFVTRRSRLLRAGQSYFAARPLGRR